MRVPFFPRNAVAQGTNARNLSRDVTRILRHGTNARQGASPITMDMADGSVSMTDLLDHPTIRANQSSEEDLRRIAQDISPMGKIRLDMFFDRHRSGYRALD